MIDEFNLVTDPILFAKNAQHGWYLYVKNNFESCLKYDINGLGRIKLTRAIEEYERKNNILK